MEDYYHRLLGESFKPAISAVSHKGAVSSKPALSLKPKRSLSNGLAGSDSRSSAGSTSSGARGSRLDAVEVSALKLGVAGPVPLVPGSIGALLEELRGPFRFASSRSSLNLLVQLLMPFPLLLVEL